MSGNNGEEEESKEKETEDFDEELADIELDFNDALRAEMYDVSDEDPRKEETNDESGD